jgi:hypothetical protein
LFVVKSLIENVVKILAVIKLEITFFKTYTDTVLGTLDIYVCVKNLI